MFRVTALNRQTAGEMKENRSSSRQHQKLPKWRLICRYQHVKQNGNGAYVSTQITISTAFWSAFITILIHVLSPQNVRVFFLGLNSRLLFT